MPFVPEKKGKSFHLLSMEGFTEETISGLGCKIWTLKEMDMQEGLCIFYE